MKSENKMQVVSGVRSSTRSNAMTLEQKYYLLWFGIYNFFFDWSIGNSMSMDFDFGVLAVWPSRR